MQFSTDSLPARQRFDVWREALMHRMARLEVTTPDVAAFSADIRFRALPSLTLSKNRLGPCSMRRTPGTLRDGDDSVTLIACVGGRLDVRAGDDEATVTPGRAILIPHHRLSDAWVAPGTRTYAVRLNRQAARQRMPALDRHVLRGTRVDDPAFAILRAYCRQLAAMPDALTEPTAALVDTQVQELVANLFAGLGSDGIIDTAPASRATRLHAIKLDIGENLSSRDLSIALVAARHRLPVRYVQRLFEEDGTTFTAFVLGERLARAHWRLNDTRDAGAKIAAIAIEAGFHNLSYFNQSFRRRYGTSPAELRAQARRSN